ncbi:MAG: 4'-phosphopantetheinyl transferase superfamily protein [Candidatus Eisenbacteria bacterium]
MRDYDARAGAVGLARDEPAGAIWRIALTELPPVDDAMLRSLSVEERERARRMAHPFVRGRYVRIHALLRQFVVASLGPACAERVRLMLGPHGKPLLAGTPPAERLHVGVAHAGSIALLALCWERPIGVDVERLRADVDELAVAQRFFAPQEAAAIAELRGLERREVFYRCWTRKEAYVKARGFGLAQGSKRFAVTVERSAPRVAWDAEDPQAHRCWGMCDVAIDVSHAAACVWRRCACVME